MALYLFILAAFAGMFSLSAAAESRDIFSFFSDEVTSAPAEVAAIIDETPAPITPVEIVEEAPAAVETSAATGEETPTEIVEAAPEEAFAAIDETPREKPTKSRRSR